MTDRARLPAPVDAVTLTDFLLARIAEDEALARAARKWTDRDWTHHQHGRHSWVAADAAAPILEDMLDEPEPGGAIVEFVASHDPARVLAECEAKRRLVDYAAFMLKAWDDKPGGAYPDMTRRERHTANVILEALALPYAEHPDYCEEWKP